MFDESSVVQLHIVAMFLIQWKRSPEVCKTHMNEDHVNEDYL